MLLLFIIRIYFYMYAVILVLIDTIVWKQYIWRFSYFSGQLVFNQYYAIKYTIWVLKLPTRTDVP